MILYHFTTRPRWMQINRAGILKPTDPVLRRDANTATLVVEHPSGGRFGLARALPGGQIEEPAQWIEAAEPPTLYDLVPAEHDLGPLVVHLTADRRGCSSIPTEKEAVRMAVDVGRHEAHPWVRWMRDHDVDEAWLGRLRRTHPDDGDWYVVERPIPRGEWVDVFEVEGFDLLWHREGLDAVHRVGEAPRKSAAVEEIGSGA